MSKYHSHGHNGPTIGEMRDIQVVKPRRWWQSRIALAFSVIGSIGIIVQSLGAGATVIEWCADILRMPGEVKNITARTTKAIEAHDAVIEERLDQVENHSTAGISNVLVEVVKLRDNNEADHTAIRVDQKAMKMAIDRITNQPPANWPQLGLLPKQTTKPN